jgi:hypothetical protein
MKDHYELHDGINGSGKIIYLVVAVDAQGNWGFIHYFTNKAEAECWMKWA